MIERILGGERDPEVLCRNLANFAFLVELILKALNDPSALETLLT